MRRVLLENLGGDGVFPPVVQDGGRRRMREPKNPAHLGSLLGGSL